MNTFKKLVITISFFMTSYNLYDPCMHCYKIAVLVTHVVKYLVEMRAPIRYTTGLES